jgi:hypothetical protein
VSMLDKAREAAREAAEQAAVGARQVAGQAGRAATEVASIAADKARDPETQEMAHQALALAGRQARGAAGKARRGVTTIIERIEPGTLADVIIRATAVQEKTNDALRRKGSLYRISEISISASIPPGINFAIGRLDEQHEAGGRGMDSIALMDPAAAAPVLALDGSDVDGSDPDADPTD